MSEDWKRRNKVLFLTINNAFAANAVIISTHLRLYFCPGIYCLRPVLNVAFYMCENLGINCEKERKGTLFKCLVVIALER